MNLALPIESSKRATRRAIPVGCARTIGYDRLAQSSVMWNRHADDLHAKAKRSAAAISAERRCGRPSAHHIQRWPTRSTRDHGTKVFDLFSCALTDPPYRDDNPAAHGRVLALQVARQAHWRVGVGGSGNCPRRAGSG